MMTKYNLDINSETINNNFKRIINLTYALLPTREEGNDWQKPLETILEELCGLYRLVIDLPFNHTTLFCLICKLEGLFTLVEEKDFGLYRRTIFECLALLNNIKDECIG